MAIIMKFGGSSVGSPESIRNVHDIVSSRLERNPVVVVSAVGGVTDMLIESARAAEKGPADSSAIAEKHDSLIKELGLEEGLLKEELEELERVLKRISDEGLNKRMLDLVQSFGERMSSRIVAAYLSKKGIASRPLFAYDAGFRTNSDFTEAELESCTYKNLKGNKQLSEKETVNVVTGFIAKDHKGDITTLGRGGSDFTAAVLGAALDAEEVQIWTDVNGIMTADPRIVDSARSVEEISFAEASEMAYFGAKVVHPKTMLPAMEENIPVVVMNTHNKGHRGTVIKKKPDKQEVFRAVSSKKNITIIRVVSSRMLGAHGFLARLFEIFNDHRIVVDMISTSEVSVSVTVNNTENLNYAIEELERIGRVEVREGMAIICVIGGGMKEQPGIAGKIFTVCGMKDIKVEMISQGASRVNLSFIVSNEDADNAVKALHKALIEGDDQCLKGKAALETLKSGQA